LCVADGVTREIGAGAGTFALTGAPEHPTLTVDVVGVDGEVASRAGPIAIVGYAEVLLDECAGCDPCVGGGEVSDAESATVVGVRFARSVE
jgi:hypothetical protein